MFTCANLGSAIMFFYAYKHVACPRERNLVCHELLRTLMDSNNWLSSMNFISLHEKDKLQKQLFIK